MNTRHDVFRCMVLWMLFWSVQMAYAPLQTAALQPDIPEAQQRRGRQEIRTLLQAAETYLKNERYPEVFRSIYDAVSLEKRIGISENVYQEIFTVTEQLIHHNQSSLMQYLRNKEIPLHEKNMALRELEALVEYSDAEKQPLIQGKYTGPLIRILTSPKLRVEEKTDILQDIVYEVRKHYISEEQKRQEVDRIQQNLELATQKMRDKQYAEAFYLFSESADREGAIGVSGGALYGYMEFLDFFASREASPMMEFLRKTTVSLQEKRTLFAELATLTQGQALTPHMKVAQEQFHGPLTQLMMDETLYVSQRMGLLNFVRDVIEKEYSPTP